MSADCERVKPYGRKESKTEEVREMFDNIAPNYDFMNRAMTFGLDRGWRKKAIGEIARTEARHILDIACGTGDMAILMAQTIPTAEVVGIDLSPEMLKEGRKKVISHGLAGRITLVEGDSLSMPFDDASFDAVTVAFGVRNFENLEKGYAEMLRVLRPGGKLIVLELATPQGFLTGLGYKFYTRCLIPAVGKIVSGDSRAYSYLPESIAAVPQRDKMLELMREAGFDETSFRELTFGTCLIYIAEKTI